MKKQKIIIVTSAIGRCGTSATMGLLSLAGVKTEGKTLRVKKPSPYNKKGFFELSINGLTSRFLKEPPDLGVLDAFSKKRCKDFHNLLQKEFNSFSIIGVKVLRHLLIPTFYMLRNDYNLRVITLTRNVADQARSHADIHRNPESPSLVLSKKKEIFKWKAFAKSIRKAYPLKYKSIAFETLVKNPVEVTKQLVKFSGINMPREKDIIRWIDPNLVHFDTKNKKFDPVTKCGRK